MSNEVNITEMAYGTLDPGLSFDIYHWTVGEAAYNRARVKARFFSVSPDPQIGSFELVRKIDLEITRTWVTVWVTDDGSGGTAHSFQRNVRISNVGDATAAYHLLMAETDN